MGDNTYVFGVSTSLPSQLCIYKDCMSALISFRGPDALAGFALKR